MPKNTKSTFLFSKFFLGFPFVGPQLSFFVIFLHGKAFYWFDLIEICRLRYSVVVTAWAVKIFASGQLTRKQKKVCSLKMPFDIVVFSVCIRSVFVVYKNEQENSFYLYYIWWIDLLDSQNGTFYDTTEK